MMITLVERIKKESTQKKHASDSDPQKQGTKRQQ